MAIGSGSSAMQITANAIASFPKQCFDSVNGRDCITTIIADFVATDGQVFNAQCLMCTANYTLTCALELCTKLYEERKEYTESTHKM